jgi:hypothetical protein
VTDRTTDRQQTDGVTDRQTTDRVTDRQTDRQTEEGTYRRMARYKRLILGFRSCFRQQLNRS